MTSRWLKFKWGTRTSINLQLLTSDAKCPFWGYFVGAADVPARMSNCSSVLLQIQSRFTTPRPNRRAYVGFLGPDRLLKRHRWVEACCGSRPQFHLRVHLRRSIFPAQPSAPDGFPGLAGRRSWTLIQSLRCRAHLDDPRRSTQIRRFSFETEVLRLGAGVSAPL